MSHPPFDPAQFRHVISHFMSGVAVITTHDGTDHGMTASAVSSLSLDPPMLTVCLHRRSPTQEAISRTGAFGVSILREEQDELAQRFAMPRDDKFEGVELVRGPLGQPLLRDALATIECEVAETVDGGTHRVYLAEVRHAQVAPGTPLAYYRGRFGRLEIAAEDEALAKVRRAVLARALPLDRRLDPEEIAELVQVPVPAVELALMRLLSERLVTREPSGFHQVPIDVARSDEAFDAKLVLDRGAARLAIERASDEQLEQLIAFAQATAPDAGEALDAESVGRHVAANEAFHEHMIGLAGNDTLVRAYQQLRMPSVLSAVLVRGGSAPERLAHDHVAIATALRGRDLPTSEALLAEHHVHARDAHRRAIASAGGRL